MIARIRKIDPEVAADRVDFVLSLGALLSWIAAVFVIGGWASGAF